jgi:hypothetical protein
LTLGRYLEGALLLAIALVPLHTASYMWRSRLVGEWSGAQARLAEIIADLTVVVCISEILGTVRLYRLAPVVIALAAVGLAAIWAARRFAVDRPETVESPPPLAPSPAPRAANAVALAAASVVVAEWSTETVSAYHHGMLGPDTLWYHMPFAARFVQDGSITALHYVDSQPLTAFYPASSELFHSFGILLMGNDVLSPLINTLWLGLALLASWCIGRPYGVAPVTLTGTAILFATPGLVATQPGGAYDDVVGLALLLSSVALLINSRSLSNRSALTAWAVSAAAAGLALGTKFTLIAPAAALTVAAWFVAPRGKRAQRFGLWLVALFLTGGFWYGRNLFAVGNPLPPLNVKLGPLSLPSPHETIPSSTVAHFLFSGAAWHQYFIPGFRASFGPGWWGLLGMSLVGLVLAVATGDRLLRVLGLVGLVATLAFVISPQVLAILGAPVFFTANVRYGDAAFVLGLVLLPINPLLCRWQRSRWILLAYVGILAATQFDASIWPTSFFTEHFLPAVRGVDSVVGLSVGVAVLLVGSVFLLLRSRGKRPATSRAAWITLGAIVLIAGFPLQQTYLRDRYVTSPEGGNQSQPFFNWFQSVANARVGVIGPLTDLQYPLYGRALSNYVQYLGVRGPHGDFSTFTSCRSWRTAIVNGHYRFVLISTVVTGTAAPATDTMLDMKWMEAGTDSKLIQTGVVKSGKFLQTQPPNTQYNLYEVGHNFSPQGCRTVS